MPADDLFDEEPPPQAARKAASRPAAVGSQAALGQPLATASAPAAAGTVPLAERLRPASLDEVIGQRHLLAPGRPLRAALDARRPHSMILWGPPGVGKTTLARLMARAFDRAFLPISAVLGGVKDIRDAVEQARRERDAGRGTIVFVDEVHRFNKAQQDAFLPHVESGLFAFVGATTENPSFEVNGALLSRAAVYVLKPLSVDELCALLDRAAGRVLPGLRLTEAARRLLADAADGDARRLLNDLELVAAAHGLAAVESPAAGEQAAAASDKSADSGEVADAQVSTNAGAPAGTAATTGAGATAAVDGPPACGPGGPAQADERLAASARSRPLVIELDETQVAAALADRVRRFDAGGDAFYDQISALHKSVRGSHPDAALYWLARMLDGGADARYLARRIVRMAAEDVGLADPRALRLALDAAETHERLGSPEGELALAEAVVYLACAPKSDAVYAAWNAVREAVGQGGSAPVPMHLRNAPTGLMKRLGHGRAYRHAHDEPHAYAAGETYMPEGMDEPRWYRPSERGLEARIRDRLAWLRGLDDEAGGGQADGGRSGRAASEP